MATGWIPKRERLKTELQNEYGEIEKAKSKPLPWWWKHYPYLEKPSPSVYGPSYLEKSKAWNPEWLSRKGLVASEGMVETKKQLSEVGQFAGFPVARSLKLGEPPPTREEWALSAANAALIFSGGIGGAIRGTVGKVVSASLQAGAAGVFGTETVKHWEDNPKWQNALSVVMTTVIGGVALKQALRLVPAEMRASISKTVKQAITEERGAIGKEAPFDKTQGKPVVPEKVAPEVTIKKHWTVELEQSVEGKRLTETEKLKSELHEKFNRIVEEKGIRSKEAAEARTQSIKASNEVEEAIIAYKKKSAELQAKAIPKAEVIKPIPGEPEVFTVEQYAEKQGISVAQASQKLAYKAIKGEVESLGGVNYRTIKPEAPVEAAKPLAISEDALLEKQVDLSWQSEQLGKKALKLGPTKEGKKVLAEAVRLKNEAEVIRQQRLGKPSVAPPVKAEVPPVVPPKLPVSEPEVDPFISKIRTVMAEHKEARKLTTAARKKVVGAKFGEAEKALMEVEDVEKAFPTSMAKLRGGLPTEVSAIKNRLEPQEFGQALEKIRQANFKYTDKLHAYEGLQKFLSETGEEGILAPYQTKILEKIFPGITKLNAERVKMGITKWTKIADALNLPRAALAAGDFSITLRQGAVLIARRPYLLPKVLKVQLKTLFSDKNWDYFDDLIRSDPDFPLFENVGSKVRGYLAPKPGAPGVLIAREEFYMSPLAERIPVLGKFVKASERPFTSGGNYLRFQSFKAELNIIRKAGIEPSQNEVEGLLKLVNWASGRGDLPRFLRSSAPIINALLFAPRFVFSKFQFPTLLFHESPIVRKAAAKMLVSFLGAGASIVGLAKLFGAEVEIDPRSSDFAKIKIGNTRLDIWSGYVQYIRFVAQLITNERKVTSTGEKQELNRMETIWRIFQSKESPLAGLITDLLGGTTYMGEPMFEGGTKTLRRELKNRLVPLFAQDVWDAIEADGIMGGVIASPGVLGVGVVSYKEKPVGFPKARGFGESKSIFPKARRLR